MRSEDLKPNHPRSLATEERRGEMRRSILVVTLIVAFLLAATAGVAWADKPEGFDSKGNAYGKVGETGFNQWGYNYGAAIFNGSDENYWISHAKSACVHNGEGLCSKGDLACCEALHPAAPADPASDDWLVMKWGNYEFGPHGYLVSGWITNHYRLRNPDGSADVWFFKMVYYADITQAPEGAPIIWGNWAIVLETHTGEGAYSGPFQPAGLGDGLTR
jgi:hypothetical protein